LFTAEAPPLPGPLPPGEREIEKQYSIKTLSPLAGESWREGVLRGEVILKASGRN
jgi:hypothetical protein